jgi:hypothetical protein
LAVVRAAVPLRLTLAAERVLLLAGTLAISV